MDTIKRYDLHKDDYSKLHFEIKNAKSYFQDNKAHSAIPHSHSFYQVIWFTKPGRHYVDYEIIDHDENTIFFINRNQIHYFCTDSPNEGILFHFNEYFINKGKEGLMDRFSTSIFNEIGSTFLKLSTENAKKIGLLASYIESEILSKDNYYKEQVYHFFQNILFQIERLRKVSDNIDVERQPEHKLAADFKKLIASEIENSHGIDFYVNALGTNSKTLTEVSKKVLLDTPANIIKQRKLLEAKRMLSNRAISIKEIAYGLGFDDPTYFTKYFKKGTGFTPKQFQKEHL